MSEMDEMDPEEKLRRIISHLISSEIKRKDTPRSASMHFNAALVQLLELCPDYTPPGLNRKYQQVIDSAIAEMDSLRGFVQ
jgi:hypothetical protein